MHQFIFWGCLPQPPSNAPRVRLDDFGSAPNDQNDVTYLFGFPVASFRIRTVLSWFLFHGLDVAAHGPGQALFSGHYGAECAIRFAGNADLQHGFLSADTPHGKFLPDLP